MIDPIDGTKNYVRGVPVWATLISLMEAGEGGFQPVVGVVSAPALGRRWWAAKGHGAFSGRSLTKASRLQVSRVSKLSDASFSYSSLSGWEERGRLDGFLDLTREVWRTARTATSRRTCVAEGAVDMCAEPELSLWDMAATAIVVTEAGGTFTGLDARPGPPQRQRGRVERSAPRRAAGVPRPALLKPITVSACTFPPLACLPGRPGTVVSVSAAMATCEPSTDSFAAARECQAAAGVLGSA